jgi:hypothetical protein
MFGLFRIRDEEDKKILELLKKHPNPHLKIIGEGTVAVDPEKIRQSEEYKRFTVKMREFMNRR